jgi:hypothetical protein
MLGYAVVAKIVAVVFHTYRYISGFETSLYTPVETISMSMREAWTTTVMSGIEDVMCFVGGALFVFLVVNILVAAYDGKPKVSKVE